MLALARTSGRCPSIVGALMASRHLWATFSGGRYAEDANWRQSKAKLALGAGASHAGSLPTAALIQPRQIPRDTRHKDISHPFFELDAIGINHL